MSVIRESIVDDVCDSPFPAVLSKDLKKQSFVADPNKCYRITLQVGPTAGWQSIRGLGSKRGWKTEDNPDDKDSVFVTPKYVVKELTTDGATVNGRIQSHNDFIDGLAKNTVIADGIPLVSLGNMIAVLQVKEVPGKSVDVSGILGGRSGFDIGLLNAYIDQRYELLTAKKAADDAVALANQKTKS